MIVAYRLTGLSFLGNSVAAMSGNGGLYGPGRWHPKGHRIVYLSSSISLCTLEMKVQDSGILPAYAGFTVEIPDSVSRRTITPVMLPKDWRSRASYPACQRIGAAWLSAPSDTALLIVPSAAVPLEQNILLNPLHPQARLLKTAMLGIVYTDSRLLSATASTRPASAT